MTEQESAEAPTLFKDKNGKVIKDGDILKLFHFVGTRNKKYYMYKIVKEIDGILQAIDIIELADLGIEKAHKCRVSFSGCHGENAEVIEGRFI